MFLKMVWAATKLLPGIYVASKVNTSNAHQPITFNITEKKPSLNTSFIPLKESAENIGIIDFLNFLLYRTMKVPTTALTIKWIELAIAIPRNFQSYTLHNS